MLLATTRIEDFDRWMKVDEQGWQRFASDPEVPAILKEAGHKQKPQVAMFAGRCGA